MTRPADFRMVALWEYDQKANLDDEKYTLLKGFLAWAGEQYALVKREDRPEG